MRLNVKELLKNKYVLYATLFVALSNVLGYLTIRDYRSLTLFVLIGVLSTYFSKNMIVNLGSAIVLTNLFFANNLLEGLKNKDDDEDDTKDADADAKKAAKPKKAEKEDDEEKCPEGQNMVKGKCTETFTQKNVPSSQPAPATESQEDQEVGKRIDYAATLEQAYDNLQGILGAKGMEGLTKETQKLIGQQSSLMKTLNTMSPVLNNAKATLDKFDISSLTGSLGKLKGMIEGKK